jgi:hypothetical protein
LQANYQRLYHRGISWQISYTWAKPFRAGGNFASDGAVYPTAIFSNSGLSTMSADYGTVTTPNLGPAQPAGTASYAYFHALNRFQNYMVDTGQPKQHIQFNGVIDLPFGKGKRFLGNSNWFMNELVGGFQIAGAGSILSQDFAINATNWGAIAAVACARSGSSGSTATLPRHLSLPTVAMQAAHWRPV